MNKMILFLINRRSLLLAFRLLFFFFNDTATTEIYTSSHIFPYTTLFRSAPISWARNRALVAPSISASASNSRSEEHTSELQSRELIWYAVFCLKKKKI